MICDGLIGLLIMLSEIVIDFFFDKPQLCRVFNVSAFCCFLRVTWVCYLVYNNSDLKIGVIDFFKSIISKIQCVTECLNQR